MWFKLRNLLILSIALSGFLFTANNAQAQDLLQDVSSGIALGDIGEQFTETVRIISRSGKIFILTNNNQQLTKGDFITLSLRDDGPVARAVVAKTHDGNAGIKVLKVYSLQRWGKLRKGIDVDILRGDDTALFQKKVEKKPESADDVKIEGAEDLFNDTGLIEEDIGSFYTDKRYIKPDNVVSIAYSQFSFVDEFDGDKLVNSQFSFAWAYQFSDNFWAEGLFGRTQVDGFPRTAELSVISNFTARVKYTLKAPLYTFILPYLGFQTFSVSSPNAGIPADDTPTEAARAEQEERTISEIEKTQIVIGITVLRRLVPGWFLKLDLGNDIQSVGFAIEF